MKKMIKNLMLVAVAAMAFVACSQEGNEVNILAKKTTYEFVASFDAETRSQFVEDTDGDKVFQSVWNGGEEVLLFADAGSSVYADGTATMVLPEGGDGTTATFTGEFNGTVPPAGIIKAYVPASAWNVWSEAITIPATQTPTDHSVDSAAHILFGQTDYTDNTAIDGSDIMFSHAVAYGKMTIADTFESIDEVTITIDETEKYTINTSKLTSSTIWFACNANENVNNLEVLVKSGDKTYVRTYELADGKLAFKTGRVSIFSVSNFEEYVAPAAPAFTSETTYFYDAGEYDDVLLIFSSEELGTLQLNFYNAFDGNYITPGTYYLGDYIYISDGTDYSHYNPAGTSYQLNGGSVVVSITEDKKYHFEFVNILYNESTGTLNTSYTGDIESFGMPDTRTKLATPEVEIPVVNGKDITLKWSAVEGADGYYVYCSQDNTINITTTELTATFTMPAYGTLYNFHIKAIANEDNADYRDSDEIYFQTAPTDYIYETLIWNTTDSRFELTGASVSDWRVYLNYADRTNNTMAIGTYTGCGSTSPEQGTFGAEIRSAGIYASSIGSKSTLTVEFIEGQYVIRMTHNGYTYGYKGLPEGWPTPGDSTEEPSQPTQLAMPTELTATATTDTATITWKAVANASSYDITVGATTKNVTATTATFEGLTAETTYDVSVVAVGDGTTYTNSSAATTTVTTEAESTGGGETGGEAVTYNPWACIGAIAGGTWGNFTVTLTGTGNNTDVITLSGVNVNNVDGNVTVTKGDETGSGVARIDATSYKVVFNVTIGNVTYIGTSSNAVA